MPSDPGTSGWPQYKHAPIVEASVTIYVDPLTPDHYAILGRVGEGLGPKYRVCRLLSDFNAEYLDVSSAVTGVVFSTEDGRENVQARSDGFAYSQQAPYEGWDKFLPEVRRAWEGYKSIVSPTELKRLSVMYVNLIQFPLGVPLSEFFNTYPVAPDPGTLFNSLTMNYRVAIPEIPGAEMSVLMVSLGRREHKGSVLLSNSFNFTVQKEEAVWAAMPVIRDIKNKTFESQLKPKIKVAFE